MMRRAFGVEISGNRGYGEELSTDTRAGILVAVEAGKKKAEIAREFHCSRRAVYNTISRYEYTGDTKSLPRPGRPEVTTRREKRALVRIARACPRINLNQLKNEVGAQCHSRTVYNILRTKGIRNRLAKKRPELSENNAAQRLSFAQEFREFDWTQVWFSDEMSYQRGSGKDPVWVFRTAKEAWLPQMIEPIKKSGRAPGQMVWAAFSYNDRTELFLMNRPDEPQFRRGYTAGSYIEALEEAFLGLYQPGQALIQDNAPIHKAVVTRDLIESHGIWVLDFPPNSPDLNVIEHAWWALKRELYRMHPDIEDWGQSIEVIQRINIALQQAWRNLPQSLFQELIDSMPRRLKAIRKARGWQTKY
jgi:transposase